MLDRWSRKQYKLFKEILKNKEGYSIEQTKEQLTPSREAWLDLYKVLYSSEIEFNEYSRIESIQFIPKNDNFYIRINIFRNRFLIIDFKNKTCLDENGIAKVFSESLDEALGKGDFFIEKVSDEIAAKIIDLYVTNQFVYQKGPQLRYTERKGLDKVNFLMDIATNEIAMSFQGIDNKVNYLFYKNHQLDGMSGNLDRKVASIIGEKTKDIVIPSSVVKFYKIDKESLQLKYAKDTY